MDPDARQPIRIVGRYALYAPIAAGGMATVHLGRLLGPVGFSRTVAIKRSHPEFAADPEFVSMFVDEARLAARIHHPNVVQTLDVVALDKELFLVMDFVRGEALSKLLRAVKGVGQKVPVAFACSIITGVLHGLHAAHEARSEQGEPLSIVHRDVSPQNILVGVDGNARVLDFGVAKAVGRVQTTREGQVKGKLSYLAPEQMEGRVSRRTDIYAAAVVLWEALTTEHLFQAENYGNLVSQILTQPFRAPSSLNPLVPSALDAIVAKGMTRDPEGRYATAREMATAIEHVVPLATSVEVGEWVETTAREALAVTARRVAELEGFASLPVGESGKELLFALPSSSGPDTVPERGTGVATVSDTVADVRSSSSSDAPPGGRARVRALVLMAIAALVLGAGIVAYGFGRPRSSQPQDSMPRGQTGTIDSSAAPPALMPAALPGASVESAAPVASASSTAVSLATSPSVVRPPAPGARPLLPRPKKPDCAIPYTVDDNRIRHIKPGCLK